MKIYTKKKAQSIEYLLKEIAKYKIDNLGDIRLFIYSIASKVNVSEHLINGLILDNMKRFPSSFIEKWEIYIADEYGLEIFTEKLAHEKIGEALGEWYRGFYKPKEEGEESSTKPELSLETIKEVSYDTLLRKYTPDEIWEIARGKKTDVTAEEIEQAKEVISKEIIALKLNMRKKALSPRQTEIDKIKSELEVVPAQKIITLYESELKGLLDEELLNDVASQIITIGKRIIEISNLLKIPKYIADIMINEFDPGRIGTLWHRIHAIEKAKTSAEEMEEIDNLLNMVHESVTMAGWFVEGGIDTLDRLSSQRYESIVKPKEANLNLRKKYALKVGQTWEGEAWRAESNLLIRGNTAQDIVNFEAEELGNEDIKQQAESLGIDLTKIPEKYVVWVTRTEEDALHYGKPELYNIPFGSIVLADDDEGGYLVLKNMDGLVDNLKYKKAALDVSVEKVDLDIDPGIVENNTFKQELKRLYLQEARGIYDEELEDEIISKFIFVLSNAKEDLEEDFPGEYEKGVNRLQQARTPQEKMIAIDYVLNIAHESGYLIDYLVKGGNVEFLNELSNLKVSSLNLRKKAQTEYNIGDEVEFNTTRYYGAPRKSPGGVLKGSGIIKKKNEDGTYDVEIQEVINIADDLKTVFKSGFVSPFFTDEFKSTIKETPKIEKEVPKVDLPKIDKQPEEKKEVEVEEKILISIEEPTYTIEDKLKESKPIFEEPELAFEPSPTVLENAGEDIVKEDKEKPFWQQLVDEVWKGITSPILLKKPLGNLLSFRKKYSQIDKQLFFDFYGVSLLSDQYLDVNPYAKQYKDMIVNEVKNVYVPLITKMVYAELSKHLGRVTPPNDAPGSIQTFFNFKKVEKLTLEQLAEIYYEGDWEENFGGSSWGNIVDSLIELINTTDTNQLITIIDHINDIEHNMGLLFHDFPKVEKWFSDALDVKVKSSTEQLIPYLSNELQKLVIEDLHLQGQEVVVGIPSKHLTREERFKAVLDPTTPEEVLLDAFEDVNIRLFVYDNPKVPSTTKDLLKRELKISNLNFRKKASVENHEVDFKEKHGDKIPTYTFIDFQETFKDPLLLFNCDLCGSTITMTPEEVEVNRFKIKGLPMEYNKKIIDVSLNLRKKAQNVTKQQLRRVYKQEAKGLYDEELIDEIVYDFMESLDELWREFRGGGDEETEKNIQQIEELVDILEKAKTLQQKMMAINRVINTKHSTGNYGDYVIKDLNDDYSFFDELSNLKVSSLNLRKKAQLELTVEEEKFVNNFVKQFEHLHNAEEICEDLRSEKMFIFDLTKHLEEDLKILSDRSILIAFAICDQLKEDFGKLTSLRFGVKKKKMEEPPPTKSQVTKQELINLYKQEAKGIYDEEAIDAIIAEFIRVLENGIEWYMWDLSQMDKEEEELYGDNVYFGEIDTFEEFIHSLQSAKTSQQKMVAIDIVINTAHQSGVYGEFLIQGIEPEYDPFFEELHMLSEPKIGNLTLKKKSEVVVDGTPINDAGSWAIYNGNVYVTYDETKYHVRWFEELGLPTSGKLYDDIIRGYFKDGYIVWYGTGDFNEFYDYLEELRNALKYPEDVEIRMMDKTVQEFTILAMRKNSKVPNPILKQLDYPHSWNRKDKKESDNLNLRKKAGDFITAQELLQFYKEEEKGLLTDEFVDDIITKMIYGLESIDIDYETKIDESEWESWMIEIKSSLSILNSALLQNKLNIKIGAIDEVVWKLHQGGLPNIMQGEWENVSKVLDYIFYQKGTIQLFKSNKKASTVSEPIPNDSLSESQGEHPEGMVYFQGKDRWEDREADQGFDIPYPQKQRINRDPWLWGDNPVSEQTMIGSLNLRKKFAQDEPDLPEPQVTKQELRRLYKQETKGLYDEELEDAIIADFVRVLEEWIVWSTWKIKNEPELGISRKQLRNEKQLIQLLQQAKTPQEKIIAIDQVLNVLHSGFYGNFLIKDADESFFDELSNLKLSSLDMRKTSTLTDNVSEMPENWVCEDKINLKLRRVNPPRHDKNDSIVEHNLDPHIDLASLNMKNKGRFILKALFENIEFTDRYDALGIPPPDPNTMCGGQCEGTGWVPVAKDDREEPFYTLWLEAEKENPTDDGWHFVKCPDCQGTRLQPQVSLKVASVRFKPSKEGLKKLIQMKKKALLSDIPVNFKDVDDINLHEEVLRAGMIAELDAINLYEQMASETTNMDVKRTLLDIAKEEKTHLGEFETLLLKIDKEQEEELEKGKEEIKELTALKLSLRKISQTIGMLKLIHYSPTADLEVVNPEHMGTSLHAGEEMKNITKDTPKTSNWYIVGSKEPIEVHRFGNYHVYSVEVPDTRLFNADFVEGALDLEKLKNDGYLGFTRYGQARLFEDVPVKYEGKSKVSAELFGKGKITGENALDYVVSGWENPEHFTGKNSPLRNTQYVILTAENPGGQALTEEENNSRNSVLIEKLKSVGYAPIPVEGSYGGNIEHSYLVPNMTNEVALQYAQEFGQESVLTPKGLLYQDGTIAPADLSNINFESGQSDFYSKINVGDKEIKFSIPIDFENKLSLTKPESDEKIDKETVSSLNMRKKAFEGQPTDKNYNSPSLLLREEQSPQTGTPGEATQLDVPGTAEEARWNKENLLKKKKPTKELIFPAFNIPQGYEGEDVRQL